MPKSIAIPLAALAAAAAVGFCRLRGGALDMPQRAGADALAILFGDVRMLICRQMIAKADAYFHGGVTGLDCSLEHHHHAHGRDGDIDDADEHPGHDEHHEHDGHHPGEDLDEDHEDAAPAEQASVRAPWAFVTRAIRLPSVERHLEGASTREMLPWLWAACRVDSGNVNAYANAAYVLESLDGGGTNALVVLEEGIAANPSSSELEFQKGLLLLRERNPAQAEAAFAAALAKAPGDRHLENREDTDASLVSLRSLAMLGKLASDRGDKASLRRYYGQARAIDPDHNATASLRRLVEASGRE